MDTTSIKSPKKITIKYNLNAEIEKVWKVMIDHELLLKYVLGEYVESYKFTKEGRIDKLGAEITIHGVENKGYFKCIDVMLEPHYKKLKFSVTYDNKESSTDHEFTQILISNTFDGTTIVVWECDNEADQLMTPLALEKYKQSRLGCLKRLSDYLSQDENKFSQYESIMIDATRNEIWDIITDWEVMRRISPCVADVVEYDGDEIKEGTHLKLIYNIEKNFVCDFKVVKVYNEVNSQDWKYHLELIHSCPKIPYQEIRFAIVFLKSDRCFLTFEHVYKERLDDNMLFNISMQKKGILNDIKNFLLK